MIKQLVKITPMFFAAFLIVESFLIREELERNNRNMRDLLFYYCVRGARTELFETITSTQPPISIYSENKRVGSVSLAGQKTLPDGRFQTSYKVECR